MAAARAGKVGGSAIGTVVEATSPRTKADEVKLMFKLFDVDDDGKVTIAEMRSILASLDPKLWTEDKLDKIMSAYDDSGDGCLQFTEFWGWVCGHGGKQTSDFKPALLAQATEEDRARRAENKRKLDLLEAKEQKKREQAEEAARKLLEREKGDRLARKDYIAATMGIGLTHEVAAELYLQGDADLDGEIDHQERLWIAGDRAATTSQIRNLYQQSAGGHLDAKGNLDIKATDQSGINSIVEAFCSWDANGDGTIESEELARVLHVLNPRLGKQTVEALCKEIDRDANGVIDIMEFVGWLSGEHTKKAKMKKSAKEDQEAKLAQSLHRKRAEEARKLNVQATFEEAMHTFIKPWCEKKKIKYACGKLYTGPGARQMCISCGDRHAWVCHGCGFVSFYAECINGCSFGKVGWSCIDGNCVKKCGCKKKPEVWQRSGKVHDLPILSLQVKKIIDKAGLGEPTPVAEGEGANEDSNNNSEDSKDGSKAGEKKEDVAASEPTTAPTSTSVTPEPAS